MKLRSQTVAILIALLVTAVTIYNLRGNISALSKVQVDRLHHIERARQEAQAVPFTEREHRLERRPRLEAEEAGGAGAAERSEQHPAGPLLRRSPSQGNASAGAAQEKYHVVVSVDGGIYTEWQVRICYYHYQKMRRQYPDSPMGGFTRLLHSGVADGLMQEIPTAVVDRLPEGLDQGFVVLNRPYGFLQWVRKHAGGLPEPYVLMIEPDYIFVQPPPMMATPSRSAAYHFTYMIPQANEEVLQRYNEKRVPFTAILPIGNAPVMIHRSLLEQIVEDWYDISLRMKNDPDANKAFGWILEMFAYSIASTQAPGGPLQYDLHAEFIVQPPFDGSFTSREGKQSYIIHYTYGNDYDEAGKMVYGKGVSDFFHWDKRDYSFQYLPRNIPMPPDVVQDETVRTLITCLNEATAAIEPWPLPGQPIAKE